MVWFILITSLGLTIAGGALMGAALGITGLIILHFFANGATSLAVTAVWNVLNDFTLSAIPLYMLIGEFLSESGVSARLYEALTPFFRRVPGGLLHTNIVCCTVFGAVSGSSMGTAAAIGSVAYPQMVKLGYQKNDVVASLAGGGTLGLLIPPSLSLLIYGALTDTSVGKLFVAGILPGLLLSILFMSYIYIRAKTGAITYPRDLPRLSSAEKRRRVLFASPVAILIIGVMGSIIGGFATATEAAAVGAVLAMLIGLIWGELPLSKLLDAFKRSTIGFSTLGFVLIGAVALAQSVSVLGLPKQLLDTVTLLGLGKYQLLAVIIGVYLVLGCIFEGLSMIIMTLPVVYPLMTGVGFDPVWLGVLITCMVEIAVITPPVGFNLYVLVAVTNQEVPIGAAARATLPYWIILLVLVVLFTLFPEIVLYLPNLMG
jgi:C4-dicarboxylate transporter, DctM subunit